MGIVGGDFVKSISMFMFRRFRNAFLITTISLTFVFLHCHFKEEWAERSLKFTYNKPHHPKLGLGWNSEVVSSSRVMMGAITEPINNTVAVSNTPLPKISNHQEKDQRLGEKEQYKDVISNTVKDENHGDNLDSRVDTRSLWLNEFTSDIPEHLQILLQDVLLRDFEQKNSSTPRCKRGHFKLRGMESCLKWLECKDIEEIQDGDIYGNGVGKVIHEAKWKGKFDVAVVKLRRDRHQFKLFVDRVQSGVDNMILVQPSPYATQIVGICDRGNNTVLVTEGCKFGNFRSFYASTGFRRLAPIEKFKFALQMIAEYDYLHRGLGLPRIHCDVHTVLQAFGQWVVSEDLRLFLSDLDEIPTVDKQKNILATCDCEPMGIMEQPGLLAPEIRYVQNEYNDGKCRKPVDEKSDIWKIPDLTANILVSHSGRRYFEILEGRDFDYYFKDKLKVIHDRCKRLHPSERPTSKEILIHYLKVYNEGLIEAENNKGKV